MRRRPFSDSLSNLKKCLWLSWSLGSSLVIVSASGRVVCACRIRKVFGHRRTIQVLKVEMALTLCVTRESTCRLRWPK